MKHNRKQNLKVLIVVLLLLSIGFAALNTTLKIDGTVNVARSTWDVHFENVSVTEGSVTANPAPTTNNTDTTEMIYTINFTKPGDYFEFTTDIVNDGTIDAMVDVISNDAYQNASSPTPITLPPYLTSTVTYADGGIIKQNQKLDHNTSEKIRVRVEFKKDISSSDLPSSGDTSIVFKFIGDYKQADDNAIPSRYKVYSPGDLVYFDPVTQTNCNSNSFDLDAIKNGTSTCYKWRVITVDDTMRNEKITLQMDHNLKIAVEWVSKNDYNDDTNFGTYGNTNKGPITILKTLETETSDWTIDNLNYTYNTNVASNGYGTLICTNGTCTIAGNTITSNLKARIITGEEIATITKTKTSDISWTLASSKNDTYYFSNSGYRIGTNTPTTNGDTSLSWLVENINTNNDSGATENIYRNGTHHDDYSYWLLSPASDDNAESWRVHYGGGVFPCQVYYSCNSGIRPVIEIEKTKLK